MSHDMEQIERDFLASWDKVEQYYHRLSKIDSWSKTASMVTLIEEMRQMGYDESLRTFTSHEVMVISRAREHGLLLKGQTSAQLLPIRDGTVKVYHVPDGRMVSTQFNVIKPDYVFDKIELNETLIELLDELVALPIDG